MEEFELVEADFQQYYRLDVSELSFVRYARLFGCLPPESRIMRKLAPAGAWTWQDEVQSRVLYQLDAINATLYNVNRKKGAKPAKAGELFQPDEVKKAKEEYRNRKENREERIQEQQDMRAFWQRRHKRVVIN